MSVPKRLQQLRKQKGVSQEELANEIGVSRQAVSKWESGQCLPELDNIVVLSDFFGVSTDYILKGVVSAPAAETSAPAAFRKQDIADKAELNELRLRIAGSFLYAASCFIHAMVIFLLLWNNDIENAYGHLHMQLIGAGCLLTGMGISPKKARWEIKFVNIAAVLFMIICIFASQGFIKVDLYLLFAIYAPIAAALYTAIHFIVRLKRKRRADRQTQQITK